MMVIVILCGVMLSSCSKDVLGVTDSGSGRTAGTIIVIKRSNQEAYNAKRFSGASPWDQAPLTEGVGSISILHQDLYFNDAGGNPSDVVRPMLERNLLLVSLTMQYRRPGKEGLLDLGPGAAVRIKDIELYPSSRYPSASIPLGMFKRSFAFTRGADGSVSGAAGYEGATEVYDRNRMDFSAASPLLSVSGSDVTIDQQQMLAARSSIAFDSGMVFLTSHDAVIQLNRPVQKGSIISFQRLRGPASPFPYIPSIVSYEMLQDTNAIRIPQQEVQYIIDVLRMSTGIPKVFGTSYPVWVSIIESGVCDTLTLSDAMTGAPYRYTVQQYYEFSRKVYFK